MVSGRGCRILRVRHFRTCLHGIRSGLQDLTCWMLQIVHAYLASGGDFRISRVRNTDRTCLLPVGVRTALHDLTDLEHNIVHAYNVSGRNRRISRIGNYRTYMPTRHQEGTSGSHEFETPDRTCLLGVRTALHDLTGSEHKIVHAYKVSGRGCKISRVRNTRSYMPREYQEGAAGLHE